MRTASRQPLLTAALAHMAASIRQIQTQNFELHYSALVWF